MIFIKEKDSNLFRELESYGNLSNYLNEVQCAAILDARNKVDKLLFTENYKVDFFDIYISDYSCFVLFEVVHSDPDRYLNNIRGQWFIDEDGKIYVRNNHEKEYINNSIYIFTARVQGGNTK